MCILLYIVEERRGEERRGEEKRIRRRWATRSVDSVDMRATPRFPGRVYGGQGAACTAPPPRTAWPWLPRLATTAVVACARDWNNAASSRLLAVLGFSRPPVPRPLVGATSTVRRSLIHI